MFVAGPFHVGAAGPPGLPGQNGTAGSNGSNGTNGTNGRNGTNGTNGTTWDDEWDSLNATFVPTGDLAYLAVSSDGCHAVGYGANYCVINVTNTCRPEEAEIAQPAWACKNWEFALDSVSYTNNASFYFEGADPSLGYGIGWGQTVMVQLWFQTIVYGEYASGTTAPTPPTLTPTIDLGFAEVSP